MQDVSIPIGFSHQLRHSSSEQWKSLNEAVSIPIGFSHQLRLDNEDVIIKSEGGFNPYRVFSSAETFLNV